MIKADYADFYFYIIKKLNLLKSAKSAKSAREKKLCALAPSQQTKKAQEEKTSAPL